MTNVDWKTFKRSFPFICDSCKATHWEMKNTCEKCGSEGTLRETLKIDYKLKKRK